MNISKSIKVALAQREMTVGDLAKKLDLSRQRVNSLIRADNARTDTIEKVAKALNMQASELIALGEDNEQ